ncbi:MAG: type II toxin-antitoxin system MqsA family antitoxin [Anaerolineales bacterium]
MKCAICKQGELKPGKVTVTLERKGATFVFKGVPAQVCQNCGEEYVDETVSTRLLAHADALAKEGAQVDVREYA